MGSPVRSKGCNASPVLIRKTKRKEKFENNGSKSSALSPLQTAMKEELLENTEAYFGLAFSWTRSRDLAEEALANTAVTILKLRNSSEDFQPIQLLRCIVRRRAIELVRRNIRVRRYETSIEHLGELAFRNEEGGDDYEWPMTFADVMTRAKKSLAPREWTYLLKLRKLGFDCSHEQISTQLNISERTSRVMKSTILRKMRAACGTKQ